jgi:hypothetical protein
VHIGALVWASAGFAIAIASLNAVNADARLIVVLATTLGPLAAIGSAVQLARRADRSAGMLLLASLITPTYFAWVVSVPALLVGLWLVLAPGGLNGRTDRKCTYSAV